MATALVSAITGRPVRHDVAMTGEITLRGRVLPVGGIKEKVLAAHRAGIKKIILPKENKKDLEDIPANVRRKLDFVLVEHMDQVLSKAFFLLRKRRKKAGRSRQQLNPKRKYSYELKGSRSCVYKSRNLFCALWCDTSM